MFRPASRVLLRTSTTRPIVRAVASRRFLSTAPPAQKSRSWKNATLRWGLAAGAVYYYNTHDVFAEEPAYAPAAPDADDSEALPTIEQLSAQRKERLIEAKDSSSNSIQASPVTEVTPGDESEASPIEGLEAEADQQGAFNPETGEINWDCPCLGGMANGPCGEEFKAAFSCFVHSTEEPKGMDCIDRFKGMQDCFRQYPEIYGAELEDDDDVTADELDAPASNPETAAAPVASTETPSPINNAVEDNHVDNVPTESKSTENASSNPAKKETET